MKEKVQYIGSFYRQGNKVIFVNSQWQRTEAACNPKDTFNEFEGCRIALCRAYGKDPDVGQLLEGDFLCVIPSMHGGRCYSLTDGKIYHFEKGNGKADSGNRICNIPAKSLGDLNNKFSAGVTIRFYKVN